MGLILNGILILIIMVIGIGLISGLLSRSMAFKGVGIVIFIALLWPFMTSLVVAFYKSLPLWVIIILSIVVISVLLRGVLTVFIGRHATGHFLGELTFTLFIAPFRFIGYLFGRARRRR